MFNEYIIIGYVVFLVQILYLFELSLGVHNRLIITILTIIYGALFAFSGLKEGKLKK